jgi:hypothetical protein
MIRPKRTDYSYLRGKFSAQYMVGTGRLYTGRYNFKLSKEFNSPNVISVVKTNRLRYAGHMIRCTEDLPQKAQYRAVPEGRQNQGRPKFR